MKKIPRQKITKKVGEKMSEEIRSLDSELINKKYVKTSNLLAYSVGLAGQNMTYNYISSWLFYYLESVRKIPPKLSGVITGVSRIWDSVNDPIVGAMVDKHKFKNGEKLRPLLLLTPPIIGLLSVAMFLPLNVGNAAIITVICIAYLLWDLFYSFQDVGLWGMISVSSPNSQERSRVSQWVSIGAGAGATIGSLFPTFRGIVEGMGMSTIHVFALFAIVFGLGGELLSMSAHKMKEVVETPKSKESLIEAIFVLRHNKTLLLISLARYFKDVANSILPWVYFFESREIYNLGFAKIGYGDIQVIYGFLTGAVGAVAMLFATKIAKKLGGMKRLLIVAQIANAVCRIISYFVGFNTPAQILTTMGFMAIANIPVNSMDVAHRSLTADSIDYVEYKTGKRTEGISFSMQNFISKLSSATVQLINGFVLSWLGHDSNRKNYDQNPTYMKWQWPIFMLGPVIGAVLYTIVISFVKDDKAERDMIEAELIERRKAVSEKSDGLDVPKEQNS